MPDTASSVAPQLNDATATARDFLQVFWAALDGAPQAAAKVKFTGTGALPSVFAVTDLAVAATGAAGLALSELIGEHHGDAPPLTVDRRLASFWFSRTVRPVGWKMPPQWDAVAGDYATADGWIRLHTNAAHHRAAALGVLGVPEDKEAVARAVARWQGAALESAVVEAGGCAAQMRSVDEWAAHPQGCAVAAEPLLLWRSAAEAPRAAWRGTRERPLAGVRVLDLTRILAGPVATRFLAGFGANVLRIDPPDWDEDSLAPEVTLGKRCARLDLRAAEGRARFEALLRQADVLVHGYRSDALSGLGYDEAARQRLRPGLVDISLDAYGWSGPWRERRGFDSLVQMSCGIAEAGMRLQKLDRPTPLPVQALDYATGYLLAAAALRGLTLRLPEGRGSVVRASLARTAALLTAMPVPAQRELAAETAMDLSPEIEATGWGPARRIAPPLQVSGTAMHWDHPAGPLGRAEAAW
ncbi:MAG: acyl-CoA transferase [Betaproteobacteria bacterium]|nr:acyl-CoA transferase [Betaproteobacteria bacterium]